MDVPFGAVSSVVEHYNDTVGVTGSIPVLPTILQSRIIPISFCCCSLQHLRFCSQFRVEAIVNRVWLGSAKAV